MELKKLAIRLFILMAASLSFSGCASQPKASSNEDMRAHNERLAQIEARNEGRIDNP